MSKHLTKAIAWTIVTFIGIGLGFYYLPATGTHLAMICLVSIAGFLTAFGEYLHYKQSKKVTRWEQ